MGKLVTKEERDQIVIKAIAYGESQPQIAKEMDLSVNVVCKTLKMLSMVKDGDWDAVCYAVKIGGCGMPIVEWAAERTGVAIPESVYAAAKERAKALCSKDKLTGGKDSSENTKEESNDALCLVKILESLDTIAKTNIAILDALAAITSDLKDNININGDIVTARLKEILAVLDVVKNNTRKKGL